MGGSPDHLESKLGWLVDLFPESAGRQSIAQVPMIAPEGQTRLATEPPDSVPADGNTADGNTMLR